MAIDLTTVYPSANIDTTDPNYPYGKAKNESFDGAKDYFPLEKTWINEILGFFAALLYEAGKSPNGANENRLASQYLESIQELDVSLDRLTSGTVLIETGSVTMGGAATPQVYLQGSALSAGIGATNGGSRSVTLENASVAYYGNPGTAAHGSTNVLFPITPTADVTFVTGSPNAFIFNGKTITGVDFGRVYSTRLILMNSSNVIDIPLTADYANSSGTLQLATGYCLVPTAVHYTISSFTSGYLHMSVDSSLIS